MIDIRRGRTTRALLALAMSWLLVGAAKSGPPARDTCLMFSSECLAQDQGNFSTYQRFSDKQVPIKPGDVLEYDIYIDRSSPAPQGAIDVTLKKSKALRDIDNRGIHDDQGLPAHPATDLLPAYGKWLHRRIPLDRAAGKSAQGWVLAFEGDKPGRYTMFVDNVLVRRANGSTVVVYAGGPPPARPPAGANGYTVRPALQPVERARVVDGADLSRLIADTVAFDQRGEQLADSQREVDLLERIVRLDHDADPEALEAIGRAKGILDRARRGQTKNAGAAADLNAVAAEAAQVLAPWTPLARRLTGDLVGHAHIDLQWKWDWEETVQECQKTFGQAVKFLDEYEKFTFSQSSTALYMATERRWPELFDQIRKYVKEGRWELLGGRVCEGDTNLVSPESHARQFLYGQRYFRERFGKQAVVGWEPDTFGHCWTMPEILRNGGCESYYFMRGGRKLPVFWWEGPDGSRVLAFDEGATPNARYGGGLTEKQVDEIVDFREKTGFHDALLAYGVGNHGGGPTRESIERALGWMKKPYLPAIRFSTAGAFFDSLKDQSGFANIPVYNGELNGVFDGVYSAHGDIKRWNRDAEAWTETAEAVAAIAARQGFPYPGLEFRRSWEDIAWNAHHDTLGGTSTHSPYEKSRRMFARVIDSGRAIARDALAHLARRADAPAGALLVFNPVGWPRDAVVECEALDTASSSVAVADGQAPAPVQTVDPAGRGAVFVAHDLPPYGYRCYTIESRPANRAEKPILADGGVSISKDGATLENACLRVVIDPKGGVVRSLFDKRAGREIVPRGGAMNRLEAVETEQYGGAWWFGRIQNLEPQLRPVRLKVVESGPARATVEFSRRFRQSPITQRVSLAAGSPMVEFECVIDWKELGKYKGVSPALRIAMDADLATSPTASFEIPFGSIERPLSDRERPALKWVDLSDGDRGVSLLNDSKHGFTAEGHTLRMTLVRASSFPDPTPDQYVQTVRYALFPHAGDWRTAGTVGRAAAFNHPVLAAIVPSNPAREMPPETSFLHTGSPDIAITGVKRAEDDDDLVVRFYETHGQPVQALLSTTWPVEKAARVNFLEDPQGEAGTEAGGVRIEARANEIQTLKIRLQPVPGVRMTGTRGPEPARDF